MEKKSEPIGIVTIGRNEGERLKRCLLSLPDAGFRVYVDSGSTDGSVAFAKSLGVEVVELDMTKPFSMARARNAGAQRLFELNPNLPYLQFVDGDCEMVEGWMSAAKTYLDMHPEVWVVCGRRKERFPEHSVFNRLCDLEWNTPVGEVRACGGDAMMRSQAFRKVGAFEESLIAGEEPELCVRLRKAGGEIQRLDEDMTLHDANILTFKAWWRRTMRGGYGAMDVVQRLRQTLPAPEIPFYGLVKSAPVWSLGWLAVTLLPGLIHPLLLLPGLGLWGLQSLRIARSVRGRAESMGDAWVYGFWTLLGKWPQLVGLMKYRYDIRKGKPITLIEYK
jgi:glycosyltransferase involved in cell wall biosynthesis